MQFVNNLTSPHMTSLPGSGCVSIGVMRSGVLDSGGNQRLSRRAVVVILATTAIVDISRVFHVGRMIHTHSSFSKGRSPTSARRVAVCSHFFPPVVASSAPSFSSVIAIVGTGVISATAIIVLSKLTMQSPVCSAVSVFRSVGRSQI